MDTLTTVVNTVAKAGGGTGMVAILLGIVAQAWRAAPKLPNWGLYPALLFAAIGAQFIWGPDLTLNQKFFQNAFDAWLISLGVNRITSDLATGTPLETRRVHESEQKEKSK